MAIQVTPAVIEHLRTANMKQRQIAATNWSEDLAPMAASAGATTRVPLRMSGVIDLVLDDTNAFWRAHQ